MALAPSRWLSEVAENDPFVREADLSIRETYRAELWSKTFLGLSGGHMCKTFGFDRNMYPLLVLQLLTAFTVLKLLLFLVHCCNEQPAKEEPELENVPAASAAPGIEEPAITELSRFGDLVEEQLGVCSRLGVPVQPAGEATRAEAESAEPALPLDPDPGWVTDIEALREDVRQRVSGILEKWSKDKAPVEPVVPKEEPEVQPESWMVILYLRVQAVLSCLVLLGIGASVCTAPHDHDAWSAYCLFVYAYANSGLLPTSVLGVTYLLASASNPLFLVPSSDAGGRTDPSYQLLPTGSEGPSSTALAAKKAKAEEQARKQAMLALVPSLAPLLCIAVTHVLPFVVLYVWVALIGVILLRAAARLGQLCDPCLGWITRFPAATLFVPAQQTLRQAELGVILLQLVMGVFVLMSVMTMTRVYAGEYLHGGYLDQLLEYLIKDRRIWAETSCPWANANRLLDAMLRWT